MYNPTHFQEQKVDVLLGLMREFPLATVIRQTEGELVADHVPLLYKPSEGGLGFLMGHVARSNPLWTVSPNQELLLVFQGPSTYISPNWYATKAEHHKVVPTWNYAVVHVYCTLEAIEEEGELLAILSELTERHESTQPKPWHIGDAPEDFTKTLLRQIVGLRLTIRSWQGKWKVSQNQPLQNRETVINNLMDMQTDVHIQMATLIKSRGR